MKRKPSNKSPKKKRSPCQGWNNSTKNQCERIDCHYVKRKTGETYCRVPRRRSSKRKSPKSPTKRRKSPKSLKRRRSPKSPKRRKSPCQGRRNVSVQSCSNIGCLHVKPKLGPTYCRSPMKRRPKSPRSPKRARKTRNTSPRVRFSPYITEI
jgi:hypothetical protein